MPRVRVITLRVKDAPLFDCIKLRGDEHETFPQLLHDIKNGPVRASDLESKYGISVYNLLRKLVNSGMVEKTEQGYVLSTHFSQLLRKFAEEWEEFVGVID
ncbi:hypothetical protein [Archaeoglobus sp.]